ncbi:hypothetical protein [Succinimonas sp.]|uniref:hypothetical protein n=1 Tax=Succinimonas sp. TaxID=1936151 RepID=UPI00386B3E49
MTYNDLSSAEIVTLQAYAAVLGIRLEQINGTLGFTDDRNHDIVYRRDITKELITLIIETEEANGQAAWENIDLDNAGDDCRCWYPL